MSAQFLAFKTTEKLAQSTLNFTVLVWKSFPFTNANNFKLIYFIFSALPTHVLNALVSIPSSCWLRIYFVEEILATGWDDTNNTFSIPVYILNSQHFCSQIQTDESHLIKSKFYSWNQMMELRKCAVHRNSHIERNQFDFCTLKLLIRNCFEH